MHNVTMHFTYETIILNQVYPKPGHFSNFVVLLAKQYAQRCLGQKYNERQFRNKVAKTRSYELYGALQNNGIKQHVAKWCVANEQGDREYNGTSICDEYAQHYIENMN